ncbi:MAG: hypothetical protein JJ846_008705 [Prochlorococcus marinus CUG1437]|nr:hypothetical protein [Prochlorococcus marinus CUG1437]
MFLNYLPSEMVEVVGLTMIFFISSWNYLNFIIYIRSGKYKESIFKEG